MAGWKLTGIYWLTWGLLTRFLLTVTSEVTRFFLEEDCDFSRFASAMKAAGREFQTIEVNEPRSDSWVRLLPSYEPDMIEPDMVSDEARSYGPQGRAA